MMQCGVSATSVHPGGIKTGILRSGRAHSSIRALGFDERDFFSKMEKAFINEADTTARTIVRAIVKNKRRALVGPDAYVYDGLVRLLPSAYQPMIRAYFKYLVK
jgi:short-subunit dehydrogenase